MKTSPHRWTSPALTGVLRESFDEIPATVPEARKGIDHALRVLSRRPAAEWVRPDHLVDEAVSGVFADPRTGTLRTDLGRNVRTAAELRAAVLDGWSPTEVYPAHVCVECYSPMTAPSGAVPPGWDFDTRLQNGGVAAMVTKKVWFHSRSPWLPSITLRDTDESWYGLSLSRLTDGRWVGDLYLHTTPVRDTLVAVHPDFVRERLQNEYGLSLFGTSRLMSGDRVDALFPDRDRELDPARGARALAPTPAAAV